MLNGLDLFSGIGGITLAFKGWVHPVAYCESDRYAQAVLLNRMAVGDLPLAPIWDDVRTLTGSMLPSIDIVYGGFPCQDISSAGRGIGLDGSRSGLYWELHRLVDECQPSFVFLENVSAIRTRGLREVVRSFADIRYDCRWTCVSAAEVGAPHLRKRWFLVANSNRKRRCFEKEPFKNMVEYIRKSSQLRDGKRKTESEMVSDSETMQRETLIGRESNRDHERSEANSYAASERRRRDVRCRPVEASDVRQNVADADCSRLEQREEMHPRRKRKSRRNSASGSGWWNFEPNVGRVADGVPFRVDRLRCLGNGVVAFQVQEAKMKLMGEQ